MDSKVLNFAIKRGDVNKVRELISQGADVKYIKDFGQKLKRTPMTQTHVETIKLFFEAGAIVDHKLVKEFLTPPCSQFATEIFTHLLDYHHNVEMLHTIFDCLLYFNDRPLALKILNLLLDRGFPINEPRDSGFSDRAMTPFHRAVFSSKIYFISLLIKHGADLEKKTEVRKMTPLALAEDHVEAMEVLLKNGANVNQKYGDLGQTVLHRASSDFCDKKKVISILIKYGADLDLLDDEGRTPLQCVPLEEIREYFNIDIIYNHHSLLKEIAILKFEEKYVSQKNLKYIQKNEVLKKNFENFLDELKKMKNCNVYNGLSLYDILKMQWQLNRVIQLTKNKNFVAAFEVSRDNESLPYYGKTLDDIFKAALHKRDILLAEEKKLFSVFKNFFPNLIICKVAQFVTKQEY